MVRFRWSASREVLVVALGVSAFATGCLFGWALRGALVPPAMAAASAPSELADALDPMVARIAALEGTIARHDRTSAAPPVEAVPEPVPSAATRSDPDAFEGEILVTEAATAYALVPPLLYLSVPMLENGAATAVFADRAARLQVGQRTDFEIDGRRCCLLLKAADREAARFFFRCRPIEESRADAESSPKG
ncbi:MAG: hypothetical protein AAFS07_03085 [Pseudomonadota bacterium]